MRLSIIIATMLVGFSFAFRYYVLSIPPNAKTIFSWGFILVLLSVLSQTPLYGTADMFAYIIILIIVLNDGYEFTSKL